MRWPTDTYTGLARPVWLWSWVCMACASTTRQTWPQRASEHCRAAEACHAAHRAERTKPNGSPELPVSTKLSPALLIWACASCCTSRMSSSSTRCNVLDTPTVGTSIRTPRWLANPKPAQPIHARAAHVALALEPRRVPIRVPRCGQAYAADAGYRCRPQAQPDSAASCNSASGARVSQRGC